MNQKLLGVLTASFLIGAFLVSVSASFLQRSADVALDTQTVGQEVYTTYCASCHGELGDGDGTAAYAFEAEGNPVTNFAASDETGDAASYQYGLNAANVPTDTALHETLMYGRGDGAMPAFSLLSTAQRDAVIAYIKTFRNGGWPSAADVAEAEVTPPAAVEQTDTDAMDEAGEADTTAPEQETEGDSEDASSDEADSSEEDASHQDTEADTSDSEE